MRIGELLTAENEEFLTAENEELLTTVDNCKEQNIGDFLKNIQAIISAIVVNVKD